MLRLGEAPPSEIGGRAVVGVTDYRVGAETRPPWRGKADLIELELEHGRVLVRPSGTEPKLKLYVDLRSPQGQSGSVSAATASLIAQARALAAAMVAALDFGAS
jgi:phosphomannomutase